MRLAITIDRSGRIVLPSEVRRQLNLGPGTRLMLDVVAQRTALTPQPQTDPEPALTAGNRTVLPPTGNAFDASAATRAEREAQARRGGTR
jgi:AbrB family looped-hinge helix DNA binding protein